MDVSCAPFWSAYSACICSIANMTIGKDVSGLLPSVLKNMQTEDLEQKKLVYLYLINYAKTQPELVILAVNTFVKVGLMHLQIRHYRLTRWPSYLLT